MPFPPVELVRSLQGRAAGVTVFRKGEMPLPPRMPVQDFMQLAVEVAARQRGVGK